MSSYRITEQVSVKAQLHVGLSESGAWLGQVCLLVWGFYWGLERGCHSPGWAHSLDARGPALNEVGGKLYVEKKSLIHWQIFPHIYSPRGLGVIRIL